MRGRSWHCRTKRDLACEKRAAIGAFPRTFLHLYSLRLPRWFSKEPKNQRGKLVLPDRIEL